MSNLKKVFVAFLATLLLLGATMPTNTLENTVVREEFTIFVNSTAIVQNNEVFVNQWGAFIVRNPYRFASNHLPGADLDVVRNMSQNYMLVSMIRELPDHEIGVYRMQGTRRVRDDAGGNIIWITGPAIVPATPDPLPTIILYVDGVRRANHRLTRNADGVIILPRTQNASREDGYDWVVRNLSALDASRLPLNLGRQPRLFEDILITFEDITISRYRIVNRREVAYANGHIIRITIPEPPPSGFPATGPVRPPVTPGIPGQVRVYFYNDRVIFPDQQPENVSGRIVVPIGPFALALGGETFWDGSASAAVIQLANSVTGEVNAVSLRIGYREMTRIRNGVALTPTTLDVAAFIQNSRTMVPVRAIAEAFNMEVYWDSANNRVLIRNSTTR